MSVWTHVSGTIRIDDMSFFTGKRNNKDVIKKILGPISTFEKPNVRTRLPFGSEGSIEYEVYQVPDESSIARFNVCFWGDLRDYDDIDEIKEWLETLEDKFKDKHMWFRDLIFDCQCENDGIHRIFVLDEKNRDIKEVQYDSFKS